MKNEKELMVKPPAGTAETAEKERPGKEEASIGVPSTAAPALESPAELAAANQKLQAEKREIYERLLRKQAELENFRKRLQREKEDLLQHATADLIRALLPVLDGFERALKQRDENVPEEFYQGIQLIHRELLEVLGRAGLVRVETSGKTFDPHVHQAVERIEAPGYRDQEIVEELQPGYKLKQRLLRPAVVKVAVRSGNSSGATEKEKRN